MSGVVQGVAHRLEMTIASLNSPRALGREAVMPLLPIRALRPWRWWKRSSSVLSSNIWGSRKFRTT